ncbi:MAG: CoA transferase [Deltaproteobacteria bacterium]|nr:CoA transferase [Deltaproteobacteria bacterium]
MFKGALDGVKVVEYATMVSGPYCGKLFADFGADVIKVEPPEGDPSRRCGPFPGDEKNPEKSALYLYNNTSKRGVTLDIKKSEGLEAFKKLLQWADVFIDNNPCDYFENLGLGWDSLQKLNPGLIYISITPYGRTGPRAHVKGDELTLTHAGGEGNLMPVRSYDLSFPPVKFGGYQVGYHGGVSAALTAMALVLGKKKTGRGHMVDIALQEVMVSLLAPILHGMRYNDNTWCRVPDRPPAMGRMETSDGYIILGAADDHHFRALRELIGKPDWLASDMWDDMVWRANHMMDIAPQMEGWMRQQKKQDIYHKIAQVAIPVGPLNTAEEVMNYQQYQARDYFVEVDHPVAGKYRYAGWPYKMSKSKPKVSRPAPLLGQHNEEVFRDVVGSSVKEGMKGRKTPPATSRKLPLEGIRVLEFCWVWAGPYATMVLANLGAEVIKVEGHRRTDLMRRSVIWPRYEPAPIMLPQNQGIAFNTLNRDKKGVTLDLSNPEGIALAKRLAAASDIVIDNMRPDAMIKMGLGYEDLRKIKEDIIVISSSGRGHEGPESNYLGFATIHQSIGGLSYISGHPEDHPTHGTGGDADILNAMTTAFAALAAVHHRINTGEGQFIDYGQCECCSSVIGEQLLGYLMTSKIPERMGNHHPEYAPHNLYPCWGVDRWLAIEVHTDEEFDALAKVMEKPELAQDPRFVDMPSRKKNEKALDGIITAWTRERDRDWMFHELCEAGVAAAPSRDGKDIYADRHLQARNFFAKIEHPELGELRMVRPPWLLSDLELPSGHAPLLGEHNKYVLQGILGLSDAEMADLRKKDIIMQDT